MKNQKQGKVLVQLDVMSNRHGHKSIIIMVTDDDPARRGEIAKDVMSMVRKSFLVQLDDGSKVVGYDAKSNSWLVTVKGKKKAMKVPAEGKKATATPMVAGG